MDELAIKDRGLPFGFSKERAFDLGSKQSFCRSKKLDQKRATFARQARSVPQKVGESPGRRIFCHLSAISGSNFTKRAFLTHYQILYLFARLGWINYILQHTYSSSYQNRKFYIFRIPVYQLVISPIRNKWVKYSINPYLATGENA